MGAKGSKRGQDSESTGEAGGGRGGANAAKGRHFTPEERREAVEAFHKSGLTQLAFMASLRRFAKKLMPRFT